MIGASFSSFRLAFFVALSSGFAGASCAREPVAPSRCGNGTLEPGEGCDDGDTRPADGCDAECAVQLGYSCEGEPSIDGAPSPRHGHTATWSGTQMILFGGNQAIDNTYERLASDGARYDPTYDVWLPLPVDRGPSARTRPSALCMGTRLVVWGGAGVRDVNAADGAILNVD